MADETKTASSANLPSSKTDDGTTGVTVPADGTGSWSKILGSPTDLTSFSPSLDFNGGNLHGLGMCMLSTLVDLFTGPWTQLYKLLFLTHRGTKLCDPAISSPQDSN